MVLSVRYDDTERLHDLAVCVHTTIVRSTDSNSFIYECLRIILTNTVIFLLRIFVFFPQSTKITEK